VYECRVASGAGGPRVETTRPAYAPAEQVVVEYSGLPGNRTDWITVVAPESPDGAHVGGQWAYTDGKREGTFTLGPLPAGRYEARLHYDWSGGGGTTVHARRSFEVRVSATAPVTHSGHLKIEPGAGQVTFYWINTPGNPKDWISVKRVGTLDTDGSPPFQYLPGPSGNATWTLAPGQYEARLYYNDSYRVEERVVFTIP
jgi:hypothetical protein